MKMLLEIDGAPSTYEEFYAVNTAEGVDQPTQEEFDSVRNLKVGEFTYIGICKISRYR